ncbi:MAG: hypothetical protein K0S10_1428 [Rubrobacteraceae bacterium]|nr:hypothetical protein [Rubrobacteraceae bacterium]
MTRRLVCATATGADFNFAAHRRILINLDQQKSQFWSWHVRFEATQSQQYTKREGVVVQAKRQDHGAVGESNLRTMSAQDERTWSVLAHLSMFVNLVTGFLGPVAALIIYLVYKDRSRKVAFHALQSMFYQIGWLVILAVGWTVTTLLLVVVIGFVLIPVMVIVSVMPFVHAGYAAYRVSNGDDYRYPFAADMVESR